MHNYLAAVLGFEPRQTESESAVLPLHNTAIFKDSVNNYIKFLLFVNRKLKIYPERKINSTACLVNTKKKIYNKEKRKVLTMSLNEFTKALIERRSTKSYIPNKQVPEEILQAVLTAGQYAPSSMNQQKRFFTVIQDIDFIKEISDKTLQMMENGGFTPTRPNMPFYLAPTVIVCSAPKDTKLGREDVACSIMNMLHAAHSYGLGSCYIGIALGIFDSDIQKRFQLPDGYEPVACVVLGYEQDAPAPAKPRRTNNIYYIR